MKIKSKIKKLIILNLVFIFFLIFPVVIKAEENVVEDLNAFGLHISDKNILENIRGGETESALQILKSDRIILWDENLKITSDQLEILTGSNNVSVFSTTIFGK